MSLSQQEGTLLAELEDTDVSGFWGFWASNGTLVAIVLSTAIQILLGILLYVDGDLVGTGILCIPTCLILPLVAYLHLRRMREARFFEQAEKARMAYDNPKITSNKDENSELSPASGDKPHEKEE